MKLDDLIQIGKTVPETIADGRETVCSVFLSRELSRSRANPLVRIYPLGRKNSPPRWSQVSAELEKNTKDSRFESWKLKGERHIGHDSINNRAFEMQQEKVDKKELADLVDAATVKSIKDANEKRLSLAFIRPRAVELTFDMNPHSEDSPQIELFGDRKVHQGSKRFPFLPRLLFEDSAGYPHNLQLREWGAFEHLRLHGGQPKGLAEALNVSDSSVLLIGNHNAHRKSWLVISVLNGIFDQLCLDHSAVTNIEELLPA